MARFGCEYLKTLGEAWGNPIFENRGGVGVPRRFFEIRFEDFGFGLLTHLVNPHHTRRTLFSEWARARENAESKKKSPLIVRRRPGGVADDGDRNPQGGEPRVSAFLFSSTGGSRTHTGSILSRTPLPLGYSAEGN